MKPEPQVFFLRLVTNCYSLEVSDSLRVQTLTVLSFEPLARYLPSGENAQHVTYLTRENRQLLRSCLAFWDLPFVDFRLIRFSQVSAHIDLTVYCTLAPNGIIFMARHSK